MTFKVIGGRICAITTADYWGKNMEACFMGPPKGMRLATGVRGGRVPRRI